MKWQIALLLFGFSAYGATLSASASTSVTCRLFLPDGSLGAPVTFTDSSTMNPASARSSCGGYTSAGATAAASYGFLSASGQAGNGGPSATDIFQATSGFTDSITLAGGGAGAIARIELTLDSYHCTDSYPTPISSGTLQVNGQNALGLSRVGSAGVICDPGGGVVLSWYFDVALMPDLPVPFGVTLNVTATPGSANGGVSGRGSLTTGITILGGLPAGESLLSQSGFDYTAVPEPGSVAPIGAGMLLMWIRRRRRAA